MNFFKRLGFQLRTIRWAKFKQVLRVFFLTILVIIILTVIIVLFSWGVTSLIDFLSQ
ncbi:hypothetical protein [Candidatus Hepatoplasma crinochetorum]|uniref:Preprotein translocase subunit SecE n=1 Tax=Candidatus Hepatoplasma crinochetorum Av TaxID=1427984 RepID=W8GG89_9MOLU|nr:hypothetical protein [Candidatus Hepatoplasma crinochetorum]AHK22608.1 hypothetical protein X271_00507 [Candidatus Hepatoplasma crinochetorum Av]